MAVLNEDAMKKNTTIIVICGLFLMADVVTFQHTLTMREALGINALSFILFAEVLAAMMLMWLAAAIMLKDKNRRKRTIKAKKTLAVVRS